MKIFHPLVRFLVLILTLLCGKAFQTLALNPQINWQINKNSIYSQNIFSTFLSSTSQTQAVSGSGSGATSSLSKKSTIDNSLLSSGTWVKIGLTQTGVYRMDYAFFRNLGFNPDNTTKKYIHIYGKPGGILPENTNAPRDKDLVENAFFVSGNGDDNFGANDYILFYGQSQTKWTFGGDKHFHHTLNPYADTSYYFITVSSNDGKRIGNQGNIGASDRNINTYDDYAVHDNDQWTDITKNVKSGRQWWGEAFDRVQSQDFGFDFSNRTANEPVYLKTILATRSLSNSSFTFSCNGNKINDFLMTANSFDFTQDYASLNAQTTSSISDNSNHLNININYNIPNDGNSYGWLDFIELNARCDLKFHNGQFNFRDTQSVSPGHINGYVMGNYNKNIDVWDVSDIHNIYSMNTTDDGSGNLIFSSPSGSLHEFVAFDGSNLYTPQNFGIIHNQNIHALVQPDMIIIAYPDFMGAAQNIAYLHRENDNFVVHVLSPQAIYNEFSGGAQDVTAFRDMAKMFYDRSVADPTLKKLKYILLVGTASYDPKYRVPNNTNFIPIYESNDPGNSISFTNSYCSDDYIGFVHNNQGTFNTNDTLEISVGRLPVSSSDEANDMFNKIARYVDAKSMKDWRNISTFVADDQNGNIFQESDENTTSMVKRQNPTLNIEKIYLDAYQIQSTPSGLRYPSVQDAINKRVNSGALTVTYTGHGGEGGWSHERVLEKDDINSWNNEYAMPVFMTATCEFSRFDDPTQISAGERVLLNPHGGGIAMFTTVRLAESSGNDALTNSVFDNNIYRIDNGKPRRMGDIIRDAKNRTGWATNTRSFTLLGDPALRIALPTDTVLTDSINHVAISTGRHDTLAALTLVTISGHIADHNGNIRSNFNGLIYPTVYDKVQTITTLANVPGAGNSTPMNFNIQKNIIYKGVATVKNGEFTFSFVMPKDVSFTNSAGKISYYATDKSSDDATGTYQNIIIGGDSKHPVTEDGIGPQIQLYMNDTTFLSGGICNDTPHLIAKLWDDVGINTVGNGVGHDIIGTLNDGDPIVMNEFYSADLNNYRKGRIDYPYSQLPDGNYHLVLKAWDVANNSSEASLDFVVISSSTFTLKKLFNYPNPFSDNTTFSFEHNGDPTEELNVEINIYNLQGQLMKTIKAVPETGGSHSKTVTWDGRSDGGGAIAQGMYIYRILVTTPEGKTSTLNSKLIIYR